MNSRTSGEGERVRVCVADAKRMSSEVIATALKRSRNNFDVRALTGNSSEVFLALENSRPHVAVVSLQLEDDRLAGFKVLHQLRASNLQIPAVMLLDSAERGLVVDALSLGEHTVRNYIFRVFDKLGLSSRVELVLYALGSENSSGDQPSHDVAGKSVPALPMAGISGAMTSRK